VAAYVVAHVLRRGDELDAWTAPPSVLMLVALGSLVAMCWVTVQAAPAPKPELTSWP
jgi:hypothetical protein